MKRMLAGPASAMTLLIVSQIAGCNANGEDSLDLPESFDYIGPTVSTLTVDGDREVAYVDTGAAQSQAVLFLGGTGTSAAVTRLTDFLRGMREQLDLRLISVGRAGFGRSDSAENWTFDDYANDAKQVLDALGVDEVVVMAISGGGPYSAAFAAQNPERVRSIHLAAATSLAERSDFCDAGIDDIQSMFDNFAAHPLQWWAFPDDSPTHLIPGFSSAAADDGARTFSIDGQRGSGDAEVDEFLRYCTLPLPDVTEVSAPVYIYQGLDDTTVTPENAQRWMEVYGNVAALREYPGEGHDAQYRHWDQILMDMSGRGDQLVICQDGESTMAAEETATQLVIDGSATLGICAWQTQAN